MTKIDQLISQAYYQADSLRLLKNILESGDCNTCKKRLTCKYCPEWGQMVRYNCPFFERSAEKKNEN